MNLPNKLTTARMVITVLFLLVIAAGFKYHETVALVLFGLGGITDHLDGRLARKHKLITNFGILMDPLADKILTCTAFITFVGLQRMASWMVVIIVARELAITGMRLLAASKNIILAAEKLGKHKTVTQIVAVLSILVLMSYEQWGSLGRMVFGYNLFGWGPWVVWFTELAKWITVLFTMVSGILYLWRNRDLFIHDV